MIQNVFDKIANREPKTPEHSIKGVLRYICDTFNVSVDQLRSKSRKYPLVIARQLYCYLAHRHEGVKSTYVGLMVKRHHSTVLHSTEKIVNILENDRRPDRATITKVVNEYKLTH